MEEHPWTFTEKELLSYYKVDSHKGLTEQQVEENRRKYGPNQVEQKEGKPFWKLVIEQFDDALVKILLGAAIISFILALFEEEDRVTAFVEPLVIGLILIANATVGVVQELKAEKAIEELKAYEAETCVVLRDGKLSTRPAVDLVPGDIVEVAVGNRSPADIRILQLNSSTLKADQSILTGESVSVAKYAEAVSDERAVNQDKINILFSGTNVTIGKGRGIVIGTGRNTEIGRIGKNIEEMEETDSPLSKKLDAFAELLQKVIMIICIVVWLININHFSDPEHGGWVRGAIYYFKIAVALAVAAIPEGLPAVVTTCLTLGAIKMSHNNAIVRHLPSVETLGCTSVICSDKTGTLTTNKMSVTRAVIIGASNGKGAKLHEFEVTGITYSPDGEIFELNGSQRQKLDSPGKYPALLELSKICSLCNDSNIGYNLEERKHEVIGEPTEVALKILAEKIGFEDNSRLSSLSIDKRASACNDHWKSLFTKVATLEFSRDRKSMGTLIQNPNGTHSLMVKGAPESVIERCTRVRTNAGTVVDFTPTIRDQLKEVLDNLGGKMALRCLAVAIRDEVNPLKMDLTKTERFAEYESDLTFIGIAAMLDPPRAEVRLAVEKCRSAGIRVIVITGDNKKTAEAICRKIGVFDEDEDTEGKSYTGREFDDLTATQKIEAVKRSSLFSRVEPIHKSTLVDLLQKENQVVAMTGDGVNDAPALKKADIGVAMGSGTAVAKSVASMVLADDNFATIVASVEEGRAIYANTKQFIRYLISSNIGEVACIFLTAAFGMPEALIPVQLLWVNLVTDGLPATALGFNPPDKDIMNYPPRGVNDPIIDKTMFLRYLVVGIYIGIATVGSFAYWYLIYSGGPQVTWSQLTSFHGCKGEVRPGLSCEIFFTDYRPSTISLSVLVVIEMFNALNSLSETASILQTPPWRNPWLIIAIAISMILHFVIVYVPFLASIFNVAPINFDEWILVLAWSFPVIIIDETFKFFSRRNAHLRALKNKKQH